MTQTPVAELLRIAIARLTEASKSPRLDAELLLAHALGWPRAKLLAEREHRLAPEQAAAFLALVERRACREPIAYIVGQKAFYGRDFLVDPRVLVPRPETELLVELALQLAKNISREPQGESGTQTGSPSTSYGLRSTVYRPLLIADIGTGSGAIAISLAAELPQAHVYATDLSAGALEVATANVTRHSLGKRITLLQGDLLTPLPGPVDLIVSNPPYTILAEVEPDVLAHEPRLALEGGPDGAAIYRRMLAGIASYLRPGGAVLLEIGAWQGELVREMLGTALPGATVTVHRDLAGRERVVVGQTVKEGSPSRVPGGSNW